MFLLRCQNHTSEVAQSACPCHRDLEEIFRVGENTPPSPQLIHRHPRTFMPLVPGSTVLGLSLGKRTTMVLHLSICLQAPEDHHKTTHRNIPLTRSLPQQAMGTVHLWSWWLPELMCILLSCAHVERRAVFRRFLVEFGHWSQRHGKVV